MKNRGSKLSVISGNPVADELQKVEIRMNWLNKVFPVVSLLAVAVLYCSTAVIASPPNMHQVETVQPAQIAVTDLMPGLRMNYYLDFSKTSLSELPKADAWPGELGQPVIELNSSFGREPIFSTGSKSDVGVRLSGYLYCDVEGTYYFQALSNDGLLLFIDENIVLEDPEQHADRLSGLSSVEIKKAGYYPIRVEYFQNRGTAALKVFWQRPDHDGLVPIPASGFWHTR